MPSELKRCDWAGADPLYVTYHDEEWGVPLHDDRRRFEMLCLEGAQAGLSWITILRKRENYRKAFDRFDPRKVSKYDRRKLESLLKNEGIVRNRLKVEGTVKNAKAFLAVTRPGPFEVGPHGILQMVVDPVKLLSKQLLTPTGADKIIFWLAPILSFLAVFVLFLPMPFGPILTTLDVDLGLLLILAFAGINVLALCLAGWGSNNKWALLGAARAVSQCVAYEIPLLFALLAVAFMEGSLSLTSIVNGQGNWPWQWNVVLQPLAFLIFFVSAVAETNRTPFDLPEAESELTAGFHTEYSGMAFGLFMVARAQGLYHTKDTPEAAYTDVIELDLGCRRGVGVEATGPGIGQVPQRRAAGRCDARRRGGFAAVAESEQRKRTAASPPVNVRIAQNRRAATGRLPLLADRPRTAGISHRPDFSAAHDEQPSLGRRCIHPAGS